VQTNLPWLSTHQQQLQRARAGGRFPAGLLIHAPPGAGGDELAGFAAQLALCRTSVAPCGVCRDCRMAHALQHPDLRWVTRTENSKLIRVEQIRELCDELTLTAYAGGASVAIISPADAMNANAANALLKTLEEPRAGVTLVLVTSTPSRLPATIRSRCQRLTVTAPTRPQSLGWLMAQKPSPDWDAVLEVLGNAPLAALPIDPPQFKRVRDETAATLAQARAGQLDIPGTAERWTRGEGFELRLACVENWLTMQVDAWSAAGGQLRELRNVAHLSESASDMNIVLLLRLLEAVYELRALAVTPINRALAVEQLLWQLACSARGAAAAAAAEPAAMPAEATEAVPTPVAS